MVGREVLLWSTALTEDGLNLQMFNLVAALTRDATIVLPLMIGCGSKRALHTGAVRLAT